MGSSYSGTEFIADLVLIQSLLSDKRMAVTTGSADVCLQVWYLRIRQQTHSKRKWVQMQSRPSYLSKFLDGEMFHNWVKYMLQLFMWSPRLDKVVGAIVSMVKVQNKRVALLK